MQHTPLASSPDVLSLSLPFPFPPPPLHAATVVMAHVLPLLLISRGEHHGVDIIIILPCEVVRLPSSSYRAEKIAQGFLCDFTSRHLFVSTHHTKRAMNTKQPCEYALIVRTYHQVEPKQIGRKS